MLTDVAIPATAPSLIQGFPDILDYLTFKMLPSSPPMACTGRDLFSAFLSFSVGNAALQVSWTPYNGLKDAFRHSLGTLNGC